MSAENITLPVDASGNPDFTYMAERISELEAERISELEAYLVAAGLDNYELTTREKDILLQHQETAAFRVGDLFEGQTGDVDLQAKDIDGKGEFFVNSGVGNQGVKGRTSRPARTFPEGTITVDFFGNAYLRDFAFKMATHNHVFALIERQTIHHDAKLYIVAALGKLSALHSFSNMLTWTILKDAVIHLPVTVSGVPDFEFMAAYIRAQQKLAIADVVRLKDRIIEETRRVVG